MTEDEILNSMLFKVMSKAIKKKFPWILDLKLTEDWNDYKSLYFLDAIIDTDLLAKEFNTEPKNLILKIIPKWSILSFMFSGASQELDNEKSELDKFVNDTQEKLKIANIDLDRKFFIVNFMANGQ